MSAFFTAIDPLFGEGPRERPPITGKRGPYLTSGITQARSELTPTKRSSASFYGLTRAICPTARLILSHTAREAVNITLIDLESYARTSEVSSGPA